MWTDTHCHLDHDRYGEPADSTGDSGPRGSEIAPVDEILAAAERAGVTTFVTVGCDRASSQRAIEVAKSHANVWASVGLHPHEASFGVDSIRDLLGADRVVAVGEAGLDYYYDHSPRDVQRQAFADQIALAHECDLPLIIHTRDAWEDTFDVLLAEGVPERTVFHCFTGGPSQAHRCLDLGAFLSFSGIVTFKTAADIAEAAIACPEDRLLVETDSPYLAPVPKRGQTNRPENVALVGGHIARLRSSSTDDIAHLTSHNARIAFPRLGS